MAKEEHERFMQDKRERIAAQHQATLEAEIVLEELRLQRLRQREEAERLEGPFRRTARDTSRDRQRRQDAEAAIRVAEGPPDRGEETWVDVATARGRQPRSPSRRGKIEMLLPPWGGPSILLRTTTIPWIGPKGPVLLKELLQGEAREAGLPC